VQGSALVGIALNTFREVMRQPFFYLLVGAGLVGLIVTLFLPWFTLGNDTDMYKEIGLSFILIFTLLAGVLSASTSVAREVEDRTAQTILAKALDRGVFILGKYLGVLATVAIAVAILGLVLSAATYYRVWLDANLSGVRVPTGVGYEAEAFRATRWNQSLTVIPGVALVFLQVSVMVAVATALSARFSVTASVALALVAFVVGHLTLFLEGGQRTAGEASRALGQGVLAVVPFLEIFNINRKLAHTILTPFAAGTPGAAEWTAVWAYVGMAALYALAYSVFAIGLGVLLFRRRAIS
jgi:ABC-type transport system involved in multi-copper enzyme maturation permease subunit